MTPSVPVARTCQRCAQALTGRARKWCSEACRVAAFYDDRGGWQVFYYPRSTVHFVTCSECRRLFTARTSKARVCGRPCELLRKARLARQRYVADPATELERRRVARQNASDQERANNRARNQRRRAVVFGAEAEDFTPLEIFERDGWVCQLCTRPIDPTLRYPDLMSASLDHAVPLSLGGAHTRANCRATHFTCNVARGNRVS